MKRFVLFFIVLYQRYVSPLKGPTCRFRPTCSDYAAEAIEKYGLSRGGMLALSRLIRCHPFSRGGYDPLIDKGDDRQ